MKKKLLCFLWWKFSAENLKSVKYHTFSKKHLFFPLFAVSLRTKMKNYLKKNNQMKY